MSGPVSVPESNCPHCGVGVDVAGTFCCLGCSAAFQLVKDKRLERYRTYANEPLPRGGAPTERAFLAPLLEKRVAGQGLTIDVQGITCGACVWVLEEVAQRHGLFAEVNPGVGRLRIDGGTSDAVGHYLDDVETLGYRLGPPQKTGDEARDILVLKAGVCAALAMTAMSFSFSRYFGLDDGPMARLFLGGEAITALLSVIVGGSTFFASSWRTLRFGVIGFDVPIALGILAAFVGSVVNVVVGDENGVFFDAVSMFVALMIGGRLAQRSLLQRSRAQLLTDNGLMGLPVVVLKDGVPTPTTAAAVKKGDRLLVRPGDIVPAQAIATSEATYSLAWITGEVEPRPIAQNGIVPAGAALSSRSSVILDVDEDASASSLAAQLASGKTDDDVKDGWQRFAQASVVLVLAATAVAAVVWTIVDGPARALAVATAVLVVTCPCAIGLALPLADELATRQLRHRGVFVRRSSFFERLLAVKHVVLDKTGTVTVGNLVLSPESRRAIDALADADIDRLFQIVSRSNHPKSRAIAGVLGARVLRTDIHVDEEAGVGLRTTIDGEPVAVVGSGNGTLLRIGSRVALELFYVEELQRDALREVQGLQARGVTVSLASGDAPSKVAAIGKALGIVDVHHSLTPAGKAALVSSMGASSVLFVGDGINDAQAFEAAGVCGTPALDRPQLPARSDFYVVHHGLGPLSAILDIGRQHHRASRAALTFAVVYNGVVVPAALLGVLTPLLCALLMPLSSVAVVLIVQAAFSAGASAPASSSRASVSSLAPAGAS